MLISAGLIAYLGAFTAAFRQQLVEGFLSLCKSQVSVSFKAAVLHASVWQWLKVALLRACF
jgi:hypothetical protein